MAHIDAKHRFFEHLRGVNPTSDQNTNAKDSADASGEVGLGQWVRDQILIAKPHLTIKDLDGDGTTGTIDDFVVYYENNRAHLEKTIPFFRWAASMDPGNMVIHNPIHDYMSLASNIMPPDQIRDTYRLLGQIIAGARLYTNAYMKSEEVFEVLQDEMEREDLHFGTFDTSLFLLAAAHQLDLPVSDEPAVNDVFLSYQDDAIKTFEPLKLMSTFYHDHGMTLERRGDFVEASDYYEAALSLDTISAPAWDGLGRMLLKLKEHTAAIKVYDRALTTNPEDPRAYSGRGEVWYDMKMYPLALQDFRKALELDPTSARAHVDCGRLLHRIGSNTRARTYFDQALDLDPKSAAAYFYRARLNHQEGKHDSALKDYRQAYMQDGRLSDAYYYRGKIYYEIARRKDSTWYYKLAGRYYTRAINSNWQHAKAAYYIDRGIVRHVLKEYAKAERDFSEAIRIDPTATAAWVERGILRHYGEDFLKALADFTEAIRLDPKNIEALRRRAELYIDLKQQDKAFHDFECITKIDPKNADAFYNLGLIHQYKNKDIEALTIFTKAIDIDPKNAKASYYYSRGLTWYKLDKFNKAFDDFDRTIKKDKRHAKAYYYRSMIWKSWRQYEKARIDFAAACNHDNTLCLKRTPPDQPSEGSKPVPSSDNPQQNDR